MSSSDTSLPRLDEPYDVPPDAIEAYRRDGHVLLRGVATRDEVEAFRPHIQRCVKAAGKDRVPLEQRDAYHKAFLQVANLWETDRQVARFTLARRFARVAAELMGVPAVRLYHDQALFKEPGGGPTFWHQDQYYWPLDTDRTITMWMPLVDCPVEMGVLTFASGSHRDRLLVDRPIGPESDAELRRRIEQNGWPIAQQPLSVGDATFHSGWCVHYAPGNQTDRMREVMTVIYYADGARVVEPHNEHRQKDLDRWLPGCKPGNPAASPLNPVLYDASRT